MAAPSLLPDFEVRFARSPAELSAVREIRRRVFGLEQGVPHAGEDDADDWRSLHALAVIPEGAIGTGRLTLPDIERPHAVIAWVATLADYRGQGVATAIMHALIDAADEADAPTVLLSAQVHALRFYHRLGFAPYGDRFTAGGILHQLMHRPRP
ncbi:MAG: GNAT family N-acetyltransferase [Thermomicrobiales bacterium]